MGDRDERRGASGELLGDLPGALYHDSSYAAVVVDELRAAALQAQDRARELRARTMVVLADSQRVVEQAGDFGSSRLRELEDENAGLRRAMETRAVIEQAKGIVMAATGCDADRAFALLAMQSQHENRKVAIVAAELVRSRVQPTAPDDE